MAAGLRWLSAGGVVLGVAALVVLCHAPSPEAAEGDPDRHDESVAGEVREVLVAASSALIVGDESELLELWDTAGIQLTPGSPMLTGRAAIGEAMRTRLRDHPVLGASVTIEEIESSGGLAIARGFYAQQIDAPSPEVSGRFLAVLKREPDGAWRLYREWYDLESGAAEGREGGDW